MCLRMRTVNVRCSQLASVEYNVGPTINIEASGNGCYSLMSLDRSVMRVAVNSSVHRGIARTSVGLIVPLEVAACGWSDFVILNNSPWQRHSRDCCQGGAPRDEP